MSFSKGTPSRGDDSKGIKQKRLSTTFSSKRVADASRPVYVQNGSSLEKKIMRILVK